MVGQCDLEDVVLLWLQAPIQDGSEGPPFCVHGDHKLDLDARFSKPRQSPGLSPTEGGILFCSLAIKRSRKDRYYPVETR